MGRTVRGMSAQRPSPAFAAEEQARGDNLARFVANVASNPANATNASLPHYQAAIQNAYSNAGAHGEQPKDRP